MKDHKAQAGVKVHSSIPYTSDGQNPKQTYDVFFPPNLQPESPRPLLVYIHGGAWRTGDKSEYSYLGTHFAQNYNIPTLVPSYRLSPKVTHPTHLQDVALAISHFINTSHTHLPSPITQIYISGHSAGGFMSTLLSLLPEYLDKADAETSSPTRTYTLIKGIIGIQGIYSIPNLLSVWPSYSSFIHPAFGADTSLYPLTSPTHISPSTLTNHSLTHPTLPPYLLIHSPNDELVDFGQTKDLEVRLRALDADVEVVGEGLKGTHFGVLKEAAFLKVLGDFVEGQWSKSHPH
ncbi:Kynurenine formamidase [Rhizophlyctis rosea]|uniref:Kynurenine formamidase n=1 Tax=Rhizophlyctis rosea TaxID=64517 RepID=A0AAD5X4R2_9FUNG|nr:Kynurenine formamidase [Rhizophlyctis rosea]